MLNAQKESDDDDPLQMRIDYLVDSAYKLFDKIPSVSHYLMRSAIRFSKDAKKGLKRSNVCKNCGTILVPCVSLEVRCKKTNKRNRRRFKRYLKGTAATKKNICHKNKMVYKCKVCFNVMNLPGATKVIKS